MSATISGGVNDAQDVITRALEYLEAGELAMVWHVLQDQEQMDSFKGMLAELEKAVPDWQMGGFRSEAAYLDFQRQSIRVDQAVFGIHGRPALSMAFARMMSLRMIAVMATLAGFPTPTSWMYLALRSGLNRMATKAGM